MSNNADVPRIVWEANMIERLLKELERPANREVFVNWFRKTVLKSIKIDTEFRPIVCRNIASKLLPELYVTNEALASKKVYDKIHKLQSRYFQQVQIIKSSTSKTSTKFLNILKDGPNEKTPEGVRNSWDRAQKEFPLFDRLHNLLHQGLDSFAASPKKSEPADSIASASRRPGRTRRRAVDVVSVRGTESDRSEPGSEDEVSETISASKSTVKRKSLKSRRRTISPSSSDSQERYFRAQKSGKDMKERKMAVKERELDLAEKKMALELFEKGIYSKKELADKIK